MSNEKETGISVLVALGRGSIPLAAGVWVVPEVYRPDKKCVFRWSFLSNLMATLRLSFVNEDGIFAYIFSLILLTIHFSSLSLFLSDR